MRGYTSVPLLRIAYMHEKWNVFCCKQKRLFNPFPYKISTWHATLKKKTFLGQKMDVLFGSFIGI